jgi:hypothetical protein
MIKNLEILSLDSIEKLRNIVKTSSDFRLTSLEEIVSRYDLKMVSSQFSIDGNVELVLPEGNDWNHNNDQINSKIIYKALPDLNILTSTDERLWVTLAFGLFSKYSEKRWLKQTGDARNILNHWFAPTSRTRWRDHSISRLWYVGYFAKGFQEIEDFKVSDVLYWNSELINSFLGRPRTTASRKVSQIILKLLYSEFEKSNLPIFKRDPFRNFMKEIDLQGGIRDLDLIPVSELEILLNRIFFELYVAEKV